MSPPLHWRQHDRALIRGTAVGRVERVLPEDVLVDVDGLYFWVPRYALDLVPLSFNEDRPL